MIKAGIFLDVENLSRCGGWGMRYGRVIDLVQAQGNVILRVNAYIAIDRVREASDPVYRKRKEEYRGALRRAGLHLVGKEAKRYLDEDNNEVIKANADLDLAVDALCQSDNLDYLLLGTGDGDFIPLVRALQIRGKRVDVLSFGNSSAELRSIADASFNGFLIPGLLPEPPNQPNRKLGILHTVVEDRGFGFITLRTGLGNTDVRDDIFCHISAFNGISNEAFASLKTREAVIEFDFVVSDGKPKAINAREYRWERGFKQGEGSSSSSAFSSSSA